MENAQITRKQVEAIIYLSVDSLMFDDPIQCQADIDACMSNYIEIVQDEVSEELPEYDVEWNWEIVSDTGYYSDKFWDSEGKKDEYFADRIGRITHRISQDSSRWYVGKKLNAVKELREQYDGKYSLGNGCYLGVQGEGDDAVITFTDNGTDITCGQGAMKFLALDWESEIDDYINAAQEWLDEQAAEKAERMSA
jgi:hypothetical protein